MADPVPPTANPGFLTVAWREVTGLFGLLSDFGFHRFITPRIVRTVYFLSLLAAAMGAFSWTFSGFEVGFYRGVFTLVTGPLAFFIYALAARVGLEFVVAVIRIAEATEKLAKQSPPP